jgi:hypothetical protein
MKYVQTDSNDKIIGYYDDKIAPPPKGSDKITNEKWQQALNDDSSHFKFGKFSLVIEPLTQEQRIEQIKGLIGYTIDSEMKDTKYFMGFGFKYGRDSVARYPTDEEAIKLTAWQKAVWTKTAVWFDAVNSSIEDIDILTDGYIKENLPKVENY